MRLCTAKGDQEKVLDVQSQIYIASFFLGKLLSVDSFVETQFLQIMIYCKKFRSFIG